MTDREAIQDNKGAREEVGAWKVKINCNVSYSDEYL